MGLLGFTFRETMRGSYHMLSTPLDERAIEFTIAAKVDGMRRFLRDRMARIEGTVDIEGFADSRPLTGTLGLKVLDERRLPYDFVFRANDGEEYRLHGQKDVTLIALHDTMTTLPASLYDGRGTELGRAVLRFDMRSDLRFVLKSWKLQSRMDRLIASSTLLLVVDVQERLAAAMAPARMDALFRNAGILLDAAERLGIATIASEQYPKGLGPTCAPVATRLAARGIAPIAKTTFDAMGEPAIARVVASLAPRAVVVCGMDTHVCVLQTAREIARRGIDVHVVADAVASRTEENREIGLRLCERAGAFVTAAETVVFDWLERAGTQDFKAISKLVK